MDDDKISHFSNAARFFHWRYREADRLFNSENEEDKDKAEDIFRELLLESRLPMYLRARCHTDLAVCDGNYLYHARRALRLYEQFAIDEPHIKVWAEAAEATKAIVQAAEEDWEKEHGTVPPESTKAEAGTEAEGGTETEGGTAPTRSLGQFTKGPVASLQRTTFVRRQKTDETATASAFSPQMSEMETPRKGFR